MYLTDSDVKIVWAALHSTVNCDDAPWDDLTPAQGHRAVDLLKALDEKVHGALDRAERATG